MKKNLGIFLLFVGVFVAPMSVAQQFPRYAVFPQFASGSGWSSEIFFANQGLTPVTDIVISFYNESGNPLSVTSNLFSAASYTFTLDKGKSVNFQFDASGDLNQGYVVIRYPWTGSAVRATQVYRYVQDGLVRAEVGVPQQEQGENFSFPVTINSSQGINTAIALANPAAFNGVDPVTQDFILNLINPDGSIYATISERLDSGHQIADYVNELFPGLDNFVGTLSVSCPLSGGVLGLREDRQSIGGISTDSGPILGPFEASGNTQYANEPNDTPATGTLISGTRPISRVLYGTIGSNTDVDYFRFQGNAGDIISVMCTRDVEDGVTNYLDPVLIIRDQSLKMVGYNDQNGLAPQGYPMDDAFIQMKLPSSGTYYIELYDYNGYGDSNSTYWLDVKLP